MQIDVLSQNTLKLTLSRLDMFDMDIKYESLSGKNPDTKRLLSHVLRTVKLDKSAGVDFSGERLFVEAFPRPDGGCMLYISCLFEDGEIREVKSVKAPRRAVKSAACTLLCRFDSLKALEGVCKSLAWYGDRLDTTSALYSDGTEYRLYITGTDKKLLTAIVAEYGEVLNADELAYTREYCKLLVAENAVKAISELCTA
jgi:negative regulator of genetic competence, sporulation and motility